MLRKRVVSHTLSLLGINLRRILHHVHDVDFDSLAGEGVAPLAVNHLTLRVHHVIIFQRSLADSEIVLLDLLLRLLD